MGRVPVLKIWFTDDGFTCFTTVMQENLDRHQIGGGNLSMEILQEHILQAIQDKMDSLEKFILTRVKGANNTILALIESQDN